MIKESRCADCYKVDDDQIGDQVEYRSFFADRKRQTEAALKVNIEDHHFKVDRFR